MTGRAGILRWGMDEAYARLRGRLAGLDDDEFAWRPVEGCWTTRPDATGRWT